MGGRAQRLPPRRIADDHDGGLCVEPVVVVAVVVVVVVAVVVVVVAILEKAEATSYNQYIQNPKNCSAAMLSSRQIFI